jgi:hypothetical protein
VHCVRPLSGRSVEWTLIPPPTMQIKKKSALRSLALGLGLRDLYLWKREAGSFRYTFGTIFFNCYRGGGGVQLGPLGTAATTGLLCQPREIMIMEKSVE